MGWSPGGRGRGGGLRTVVAAAAILLCGLPAAGVGSTPSASTPNRASGSTARCGAVRGDRRGHVEAAEIDERNICARPARLRQAVEALSPEPEALLVDAVTIRACDGLSFPSCTATRSARLSWLRRSSPRRIATGRSSSSPGGIRVRLRAAQGGMGRLSTAEGARASDRVRSTG